MKVTHTSNRNETVTHTSNGNFEQKLLSNQTIPVVVPKMSPIIDQQISPIVMAPQTILMPATKDVVTDTVSGSAWVNSTLRKVSRTGVDGSTPGNIRNSIRVKHATSPFLIGIVGTSPTYGLSEILQVVNEHNSISPSWAVQTQKLDAFVDVNFPMILILCPFLAS